MLTEGEGGTVFISHKMSLMTLQLKVKVVKISTHERLIFSVEQLKMITELCFMYPKLVKIWFLHVMGIIVNSPELIQKVFNSEVCMEKPYIGN